MAREKKSAAPAAPAVSADLENVTLYNTTSCPIGIMRRDGTVTTLEPFSVVGTKFPRDEFRTWARTKVGQAYMDKRLVTTREGDDIGFSQTSELEKPAELANMPTQGSVEAEIVQKPTLDGGVTLPVG